MTKRRSSLLELRLRAEEKKICLFHFEPNVKKECNTLINFCAELGAFSYFINHKVQMLSCDPLHGPPGSYEDCCLKYVRRVTKTAVRMVTSYRRQETDGGCNIHAIV